MTVKAYKSKNQSGNKHWWIKSGRWDYILCSKDVEANPAGNAEKNVAIITSAMGPVKLGRRLPPPEAAEGVEDDPDGVLGVVVVDEELFVKTA